jgi:manganese/iron transport system substrate-binding protein
VKTRSWFALSLSLVVAVPALAASGVRVTCTTTIVADVVRQVAGDEVAVTVLLPIHGDPHTFEPTPQDLVAIAEADVVFINGAGLEVDVESVLGNATGPVVSLSERLALRSLEPGSDEAGFHEGADPHVWFDPTNVMIWTSVIAETLATLEPELASAYRERARIYRAALAELELWIWKQVEELPRERRKLVTDHAALGYLAARYGFEQIGAIFPGFSTLAEPAPRELAELEESIIELGISAIFVSTTANPSLAEQVATDTNAHVVLLYIGSLSERGGPADSYLNLMRYDVTAIVEGLTGED